MMDENKIHEINALNCALMTLRGEDGGFSFNEKQQAIDTLQRMFTERVNEAKGLGHPVPLRPLRRRVVGSEGETPE